MAMRTTMAEVRNDPQGLRRAGRRYSRSAGQRQGAAILEFAVVANVMFLVILACIEFSRLVMVQSLAEDAAYEAARHVIVPGAVLSEAEGVANRVLGSMHVTASSVLVQPYRGTTLQSQIDEDTTEVRVVITIPISNITLFTPKWVLPSRNIVKRSRLFTERYKGFYDGSGS